MRLAIDGPGIEPWATDDELGQMLVGCDADLVLVGHTHKPTDRTVGGVRVVNVGSVGLPPADRRASYARLDADGDGYRLSLCGVAYDTAAVIRAIYENHVFPNPDWLAAKYSEPQPGPQAVPSVYLRR